MSVVVVDAGPNQVSRAVEVPGPAFELFNIVADPRRHHELDGSGTVGENIKCPSEVVEGSKFSTKMAMWGVPYWIVSTVTAVEPTSCLSGGTRSDIAGAGSSRRCHRRSLG